jgi:hypothetical protein
MIVPDAFKTVCLSLHPDIFEDYSIEVVMQIALAYTDLPDIPILEAFLDELLSPRTSDQDLIDLWFKVPGSLRLYEAEGTRNFLRILRDQLAPRRELIEKAAAAGIEVDKMR